MFFVVDSSDLSVDVEISAAVKASVKVSMTKSFVNGNVGTTITAEKRPADGKQNQTYLWKRLGHFDELPCDFSLVQLPGVDTSLSKSGVPQLQGWKKGFLFRSIHYWISNTSY